MNAHLHAGMLFPEASQSRQESMDRTLVDAEGQFAALESFQVLESLAHFVAQVQQPLGVFFQELARVGKPHGPRAAHEQ